MELLGSNIKICLETRTPEKFLILQERETSKKIAIFQETKVSHISGYNL